MRIFLKKNIKFFNKKYSKNSIYIIKLIKFNYLYLIKKKDESKK